MKKTDTKTLIEALRLLTDHLHDEEGVGTAAILEAADRLEEQDKLLPENNLSDEDIMAKYPDLYCERDLPMSETCMCWGFECPEEWYPVLDKLSYVLSNIPPYSYKSDPDNPSSYVQVPVAVVAKQVKIKFGELRFYYTTEIMSADCSEDMPDDEAERARNYVNTYASGAIALATQLCEGEPY